MLTRASNSDGWHRIFLAPFRESVKGLTFFKHVAAHGLCSTCKMDHIIITVQLTGFGESSPDVLFRYQ